MFKITSLVLLVYFVELKDLYFFMKTCQTISLNQYLLLHGALKILWYKPYLSEDFNLLYHVFTYSFLYFLLNLV